MLSIHYSRNEPSYYYSVARQEVALLSKTEFGLVFSAAAYVYNFHGRNDEKTAEKLNLGNCRI